MIEKHQAFLCLVDACPSFRPDWDEHLREFGDDFLYIAAGYLANHLLSLHKAGREESFVPLSTAVERLLIEGSPGVKEFATVGLLEAIQNVWGNAGADLHAFARHLGLEGRRQWEQLNDFWSGTPGNVVAG